MNFGETDLIRGKKKQPDGPHKLPKNQICVNLTYCRYKIVKEVCKELGWTYFSHDEMNLNCDILWYDFATSQEMLGKLKSYQKLNHFPGIEGVARKNFLAYHVNKMKKEFPLEFNFIPLTFCLPSDNNKVYEYLKNKTKTIDPFIIKPEGSAQGRGIYLIRKFDQIPFNENMIMQSYIANPMLIEGFKFDLRIYVVMSCCDPLTLHIFDEGIV